jgi:hypothetical protein
MIPAHTMPGKDLKIMGVLDLMSKKCLVVG